MMGDTTSMSAAGTQTSQKLAEPSIKEILVVLLAIFVTCSLVFNALFAFSAFDGARMLAQVAEEHGVPVERLGVGAAEHFDAVQDRYGHTLRGKTLYYFEWMGGQWAAISIAATLALAWMWRRRGLRKALAPLILNIALLAVVFAHWATVSKIAIWLE